MSSSYPPQLHLTLPANTTSFKRSFDQFGFDLDSPVGNAEAGSSSSGSHGAGSSGSRNERNKRPRSTSSLSDGGDSLSSGSTFASGSSDTILSEGNEPEAGPSTSTTAALSPNRSVTSHILGAMSFEPPRLPTPDIQDIEMPDYPLNSGQNEVEDLAEPTSSSESPAGESTTSSEHSYSTSLERLDDLESQSYNILSPRSPVPRPSTPPPTLPPLSLPDDQTPLHANVIPFLENASQSPPALLGGRSNTTPSLSAAHALNPYHTIATRGPPPQTGAMSRSSDFDPIPAADPTGGRYSPSDSLEHFLNRNDLSSFDLELRRPTRTDSSSGSRNRRSPVAPRIDFGDASGSNSHPTSFPFVPSTSFVRRSGSFNSAPTRTESPWRQVLNVHMPSREQERSQPSRPPANRENSASQYLHSSRESPSLTLNTHPTTPLNPFSYRIPPSNSRPELPLPPRRQSSLTSNNTDHVRWFEHTDSTDSPNREQSLFGRERTSHRTGSIGGMVTDDDHAEPPFRVYSSAVDDYESTVPGLRARVMENRRSSTNAEPDVRRQHRAPPSLGFLMARGSEETSEPEPRDLPGESRRQRYIEQGLLDPRETAGRSYEGVFPSISNVTPLHQSRADERRLRLSWTNPFADLDDEDDPTPLSESERIYRASRRLGRPVPRPLSTSDRGQSFPDLFLPGDNIPGADIATGTARPRRYRPRYSSVLAGSTSLFSENAAELRRRNDRELIDRLRRAPTSGDYNWGPPSDDEFDGEALGTRTSFGRAGGNTGGLHTDTDPWSPVLPPLSHHRPRSPSPPVMPRAMTELLSQSERPSRHHSVAMHHPRSSRPTQGMPNTRRNNNPWYLNTEIPRHDLMESYDTANSSRERSREPEQPRSAYVARFSDDYSRRYGTRPTRSPSRGDHLASTTRNPRWSSFDELRRDSPAIFDSQSSSISDIARTITSHDYALSLFSHTSDISSTDLDAEMVSDTSEVYSPPNPPSIPPPDLGSTLFDSEDPPDVSPLPRSPALPTFTRFVPPLDTRDEVNSAVAPRPERSPSPISPIEFAPYLPLPPSSRFRGDNQDIGHASFEPIGNGGIDLQGFAPGPYRNTLQRLVERGRLHGSSNPPSIPPLPFENLSPSRALPQAVPSHLTSRERFVSSQPQSNRHSIDRPPHPSTQTGRTQPSLRAAQRRRFLGTGLTAADPQPRSSDDLHRHLASHTRFDAASLDPEPPLSESTSSELRGLDHALHVLRQDGLSDHRSQQLIERYHRQRRESTEASASGGGNSQTSTGLWRTLEDDRPGRWDGDRSSIEDRHFPRGPRGATSGNSASASITDDMGGFVSLPGFPHRRRPASNSPTRRERSAMPEARPPPFGRGRAFGSRLGRHRPSLADVDNDFVTLTDLLRRRTGRGTFSLGDFMRDEDFDGSYETLISLESALGEVKTRATPDHIISGLETALYKDWASDESDKRCPICLDDYKSTDQVLKLPECTHWLHKPCLEQWLKGANTCPVCRECVRTQAGPSSSRTSMRNPRFPPRNLFTIPLSAYTQTNVQAGSTNENATGTGRSSTEDSASTSPTRGRRRSSRTGNSWRSVFRPPSDPDRDM